MQATKIINTGIKLVVVLLAIVAGCGVGPRIVSADDPAKTLNLPLGITLDPSFTLQDTTYLNDSLQVLQDQSPVWFQYVSESAPFIVRIDIVQGEKGRAAITSCCDVDGRGAIVFGYHLGYSWEEDTMESRRVTFIGTLVHEVTHLREQRSGRIAVKSDFQSCVAAEKPGLERQLEVKRALFTGNMDAAYKRALEWQIAEETKALKSRALWDFYCGAFQ